MVTLNLLPEDVQTVLARRRRTQQWAAAVTLAATLLAVPLGLDWSRGARAAYLRAESQRLQADVESTRAALRATSSTANELFVQVERAKALRSKRAWSGMLALIASCMPAECWLASLATDPEVPAAGPARRAPNPTPGTPGAAAEKKEKEVVTIEAPRKLRIVGFAPDDAQPLAFVTSLKESRVFRRVALEGSVREPNRDPAVFRFELVCEW